MDYYMRYSSFGARMIRIFQIKNTFLFYILFIFVICYFDFVMQDVAIAALGPIQNLPDYNWFRRRTYMLRY